MDINCGRTKEFQVVGVSRSGRVRKKSSKLLDFESIEDLEKKKRGNRQLTRQPNGGRGRPANTMRGRELTDAFEETLNSSATVLDLDYTKHFDFSSTSLAESTINAGTPAILPSSASAIGNSDDELDNLVADLVEGVEAECSYESKVRQSLYMREKSNMRKILKDGKVVTGKAQRKDKGKARFTAYSLWAREVRKRDYQDLDFSSAARRLSELWANVSNKEKNAWRRKAKIQATKARHREKSTSQVVGGAGVSSTLTLNNSYAALNSDMGHNDFNTASNIHAPKKRVRKIAADGQLKSCGASTQPQGRSINRSKNNVLASNAGNIVGGIRSKQPAGNKRAGMVDTCLNSATSFAYSEEINKTNVEAIDAAAHLKLLGESLTIIGERLKEHDGQIALSGSLSVLLDSLLCSLGPLLCMTKQIPGLENESRLNTNLSKILDNIAYVMPGL